MLSTTVRSPRSAAAGIGARAKIQIALQVLAPQNEAFVPVRGYTNPHFSIFLPFLLQNPMYFGASVAIWRSLWLASVRESQEDRAMLHHRGNALGMLGNSIHAGDDLLRDDIAMTVVYLLIAS